MIEIDEDARSYLAAVGALAIYVAALDGKPVRVAISRDPVRTINYLRRTILLASIGWMSWFDDTKPSAADFCVEIIGHQTQLIYAPRDDGVRAARPLEQVIADIMDFAQRYELTLTPHDVALARAKRYAQRLDAALVAFQESGQLTAFNHAYRIYREQQRMRSESALPYWAAKEQLRQTMIRWLVKHQRSDPGALFAEIRQRFPWFKAYGRIHLASSRRPSSIGKV